MQLDEFVKATLVGVVKGVRDAQVALSADLGRVNPQVHQTGARSGNLHVWHKKLVPIHTVSFDVGVTTSTSEGKASSIGIEVLKIGLGKKGDSAAASEEVNRVRFTVTVSYPPAFQARSTTIEPEGYDPDDEEGE